MVIAHLLVVPFLAGGVFFLLVGAIGLLRLPDFYTRLHATGKCDTLGVGLIVLGLLIYHLFHYPQYPLVPLRLVFLIFFIFVANPTATHALIRAAYRTGLKPWKVGEERR
ncbi:MAG: monovalent cation/H(+) antiporter subunit G [Desulfobacterota bacterium]|nr:monovalent cation/H(+) antiporter subunit G [Thermodesulfobacteriota bacterium]